MSYSQPRRPCFKRSLATAEEAPVALVGGHMPNREPVLLDLMHAVSCPHRLV